MRVLDTDTCVAILRGNEELIARRERLQDSTATTWMTAAELLYGAAKARDPGAAQTRVLAFLETLSVLSPGSRAALHYGSVRAGLEKTGNHIEDTDLVVAAITLAHGAVLVTGNGRHFRRIEGLELEDWIQP